MNALSPSLLPQPLALVARLIHWLALIIRNLRILALPPSSFAVRRDEAVHTWLNNTKFASRGRLVRVYRRARRRCALAALDRAGAAATDDEFA